MPRSPFQPLLKVKSRILYAFIGCLAFCLASGSAVHAQSVDELGVAKQSLFESPLGDRDPLWPIGWTKKAPVESVVVNGVPTEIVPRAESFYVSSISLDRLPLAVVNGKPYGVGDRFVWTVDGGKEGPKQFRLQVVGIRDGAVVLRYGSTDLTCPLRIVQSVVQPQPGPKKP